MAQFAVFAVNAVPAVGTTTHARVYRGDHADQEAAVDAAAIQLGLTSSVKVWAAPVSDFTQYRVDVTHVYDSVLE